MPKWVDVHLRMYAQKKLVALESSLSWRGVASRLWLRGDVLANSAVVRTLKQRFWMIWNKTFKKVSKERTTLPSTHLWTFRSSFYVTRLRHMSFGDSACVFLAINGKHPSKDASCDQPAHRKNQPSAVEHLNIQNSLHENPLIKRWVIGHDGSWCCAWVLSHLGNGCLVGKPSSWLGVLDA